MLQRLSKGLRVAATATLLTVATYAAAQGVRADHPDTYVVKRGDTLWDIAGTFLERPWLWPEIWQANPQIENPHRIYPGDVISLAYLDRVTVDTGMRELTAQPISSVPLADIEAFLKDLRVVKRFHDMPYVVAAEENRLRGVEGQLVHVRGLSAQPGERFVIVRPTVTYSRLDRSGLCCDLLHKQDRDFRGARIRDSQVFWTNVVTPDKGHTLLGHELQRVASGTVTRGAVGGIDVTSLLLDKDGVEVRPGDRVLPVEAQPYDLEFFPHPPAREFEYGHARVLAVADTLSHGGPRDVVALSVGSADGIDNGTVFSVWAEGEKVVDRVQKGELRGEETVFHESKVRLPDDFAGHLMVFRTYEHVSYALVMDSVRPTRIGHHLKHPDAPY